MQYYIKIFNTNTNELIGYYKETGKTCISKLMNGIKYFDNVNDALEKALDMDEGFVRDRDKHYYTAHAVVFGDSSRKTPLEVKKSKKEKEEELQNEINAFIRKNSCHFEE